MRFSVFSVLRILIFCCCCRNMSMECYIESILKLFPPVMAHSHPLHQPVSSSNSFLQSEIKTSSHILVEHIRFVFFHVVKLRR